MATLILVRHGRTTANAGRILAGRTPGVLLDELGEEQAADAARRLASVPVVKVVSSPLERCRATAEHLAAAVGRSVEVDDGLTECGYGEWQGRSLDELGGTDLFRTVLTQPSAVTFPGGESMASMSARAVATIRGTDAQVSAEHGAEAVWVAVSHGDPIKAIVADALGLHLDQFQRIHVDPASATVIRYTDDRPYLLTLNSRADDLSWVGAAPAAPATAEDNSGTADSGVEAGVLGGGAGPGRTG